LCGISLYFSTPLTLTIGKILNIEKAAPERIYQNNELQSLISALGLGVKNAEFDIKALRSSQQ